MFLLCKAVSSRKTPFHKRDPNFERVDVLGPEQTAGVPLSGTLKLGNASRETIVLPAQQWGHA